MENELEKFIPFNSEKSQQLLQEINNIIIISIKNDDINIVNEFFPKELMRISPPISSSSNMPIISCLYQQE